MDCLFDKKRRRIEVIAEERSFRISHPPALNQLARLRLRDDEARCTSYEAHKHRPQGFCHARAEEVMLRADDWLNSSDAALTAMAQAELLLAEAGLD